ncbi:MAG: hypothetical protein HOE90_00075 [Bacteriovoracaceae bacterium]|jgi:hypothetical protein|nr:hypothetical protein [Bacteriovoracaceae bacterium]
MTALLWMLWLGCSPPETAQSCGDYANFPTDGTAEFVYSHESIQNIQIVMSDANMSKLPTMPDQGVDDLPADIYINGEIYSNVGLKLKGHGSFRDIDQKASFKIDLHEFNRDQTLNGMERFNLNSMIQDQAKVSDNIGYHVFQDQGLISPRQGYTCVSVNGVDYGLYSIVEALDEEFVEAQFNDPTGVLYEGSGLDLNQRGVQNFELQEGDDPDRIYLSSLVDELEKTSTESYWGFIEKNFYADELMMSFALLTYLGNRDSYLTWHNNYFLYYEPSTAKWTFIPWGMDQLFDETLLLNDPLSERPDPGILFINCLDSDECHESFLEKLAEVNSMVEDGSLPFYLQTELDRIYTLSHHDPRDESTAWGVERDSQKAIDFLDNRLEEFRQLYK